MQELTLYIEGMTCGHCLNAVNQALAAHPGVRVDSVQMGRATVGYDPAMTDPSRIIAAVHDAGYEAVMSENAQWGVDG